MFKVKKYDMMIAESEKNTPELQHSLSSQLNSDATAANFL